MSEQRDATTLVWGDPPQKNRSRAFKYARGVDALKSRPGEWACILVTPSQGQAAGMAHNLPKIKTYQALSAPYRIEARSMKLVDEQLDGVPTRYGLWARVVPEEPAA